MTAILVSFWYVVARSHRTNWSVEYYAADSGYLPQKNR